MNFDINRVCDGYGCNSIAEFEIVVKVGPKRSISLSLCGSCKTKFKDHQRSDVSIQKSEPVSVTYHDIHNSTKNDPKPRSIQVGGRGQIAADTSVGADAIRQWNILHSSFKRFVQISKDATTAKQRSDVNALLIQKLVENVNA